MKRRPAKKCRYPITNIDTDRNYRDPKYIAWRKLVYKRDGFRCQMPGCNSIRGGILHAHHIQKWADNPSLRFVVGNGITLCKKCHVRVTENEEAFQGLLVGIAIKNGNPGSDISQDLRLGMVMNRHGKRSETET